MLEFLLSPLAAFPTYLLLVGILSGVGHLLAGRGHTTPLKNSLYASGEAPPQGRAIPGYRAFFLIALFFAVLHLGVLALGSSDFSATSAAYTIGLGLVLFVLLLG